VRDTSTTKYRGINHWLMLDLIGRKIRLHTDRLHEERAQVAPDELKAENGRRRPAGERKEPGSYRSG